MTAAAPSPAATAPTGPAAGSGQAELVPGKEGPGGYSWGWRWVHRDGVEVLTRRSHPFDLDALPPPQRQRRGHPHAPLAWRAAA